MYSDRLRKKYFTAPSQPLFTSGVIVVLYVEQHRTMNPNERPINLDPEPQHLRREERHTLHRARAVNGREANEAKAQSNTCYLRSAVFRIEVVRAGRQIPRKNLRVPNDEVASVSTDVQRVRSLEV